MSRFFLLRHAQSIANQQGFLAGRLPDIHLSSKGLSERRNLVARAKGSDFDSYISSPMLRCQQTIEFIVKNSKQPLIIESGFNEVDYGDWTGRKFNALKRNSEWREIITRGSKIKFQNGESVKDVQRRTIESLRSYDGKKSKNILISTHADVIKFAIFHALGTSLDNLDRLQIDNASISIIDINRDEFTVRAVNDRTAKFSEYLA